MLKLNKQVVLFIAILLFAVTRITYSAFIDFGSVNTLTNVAAWSIKINGQDVSSSSSFTLDKIVWNKNEKIANGYVAPGGQGYYEIKIDTTGTKVAVDYTIGFDSSVLEQNTRMRVDKVTFDDVKVDSIDGYYDGFISLEEVLNNKIISIKIYISWDEANDEIDDYLDMQSVLDYGNIELPMVVSVRQHIEDTDSGENLIAQLLPYKESLLQTERPAGLGINPYYQANLDALYQNPERGLYSSNFLGLSKSGNTTKDMEAKVSKLLYLKVDLSAFSAWRNGTDIELTEDAINALDSQLEIIKQHNNTVILRFVYDNNATGIYNDNKTKFEPEQETLIKHIKQLENVFQKYSTTIYTIQIGFYGLWGESCFNTDVNSHPEYYKQTMEALLDATAGTEITIAFRTPSYAKSAIENSNYDPSRIGMFNDAYLSKNDDMGTYVNRDKEVEWLNKRNVSYGGEALPSSYTDTSETTYAYGNNYANVGGLDNYIKSLETATENWDLIKFTEDEMFKTHTSYINFEWNQYKHYIWAHQIYNGKDELYHGKTALEYIQNHLGYRLVLKNVELPRSSISAKNINANITIENVGFGNVIKSKTATILFVDLNSNVIDSVDITNEFDIKSFLSETKITKNFTFNLPDLPSGTYRVFLRIANDEILNDGTYYNAIRFANNNIWNEALQANHIGSIKIK